MSHSQHNPGAGHHYIRDLTHDLTAAMAGEVRFDEGSRALYATDGIHSVMGWQDLSASKGATVLRLPCAVANGFCFPPCAKLLDDTLIIADGFSCQEQIRQDTAREALHSVQVLQIALRQPSDVNVATPPELPFIERRNSDHVAATRKMISLIAGAGAVTALFWMQGRRRVRS